MNGCLQASTPAQTPVALGGEFYIPRCVVKLLVEMLEPRRGRGYDPGSGSMGMFLQSVVWTESRTLAISART